MPVNRADLMKDLTAFFPDAVIDLVALVNDDNHWALTIESKQFAGLSKVQQHQLVYRALKGKIDGPLHALQLTTKMLS